MRFFYDALFFIFLVFSIPKAFKRWFLNRDYRGILRKRFFCSRPSSQTYPCIWLNGVSAGEIISLQPLVKCFEKKYPGIELVISATTGTGFKRAKSLYGQHCVIVYPFDFSLIVSLFINRIKPNIFITAELDLWPNFLLSCKKRSIPYLVVSGRLTENSTKGYEKVKNFLSEPFEAITNFLAQDHIDAERASRIGISEDKIQVCGNLKFDLITTELDHLPEICSYINNHSKKVLILASTHAPEEKMILEMLSEMKWNEEFSEWRLILVPRHPERAKEVKNLLEQLGFNSIFYTEIASNGNNLDQQHIIVDKIGVLKFLYSCSDLCFVGKTLAKEGGQNMIEPAALGVPTIFGPNVQNFREASNLLLEHEAAIQIQNIKHLSTELRKLLIDGLDERLKLSRNAVKAIKMKQGVSLKTFKWIEHILKG